VSPSLVRDFPSSPLRRLYQTKSVISSNYLPLTLGFLRLHVVYHCTIRVVVFVLSVPIPPTLPRIFILFISITGPLFCFLCHVQGAFGRPLAIMRVSFRGWCIVLVLPLALICVIHPRLGRSDPPYCLCVIWTHSGLIYVICH